MLANGTLRQSGGSILGNEARQNSKLREALGLDYFNGECPPSSLEHVSDTQPSTSTPL